MKKTVYFVGGTGTGVGKSVIACALSAFLRAKGLRVGVMKPISCGGVNDARALLRASGFNASVKQVCPLRLRHPLSPNVAAALEHVKIRRDFFWHSFKSILKQSEVVVVEGCGGVYVPINNNYVVADIAKTMGASMIVVADSRLGTINHTLLTLDFLKRKSIDVLGVIYNRNHSRKKLGQDELSSPGAIKKISGIRALGYFPHLNRMSSDCLAEAFRKHIDFKVFI